MKAWCVRPADDSVARIEQLGGAGAGIVDGFDLRELAGEARSGKDFLWVALTDPTSIEIDEVGRTFGLPALLVEDALNSDQRAKIEWFDHQRMVIVIKWLRYIDETSEIETDQMSVFVGPRYVVTVGLGVPSELSEEALHSMVSELSSGVDSSNPGPVAVLHLILDKAVDGYLAVAEEVSARVEGIEESVFAPGRSDEAEAIYLLKRENLEIRRAVAPLLPAARRLVRDEGRHVPRSLRPYFRDVADHLLRVSDTVDSNDSLLMAMLMAARARADLEQNRDMRRISAWVAIAAVPTMIAGIYGMNFEDMPELHWALGYPLILTVMASACAFMHHRFRQAGWL